MLDKVANYTADLLSANHIIKEDDKEIYAYGIEVILSTVINLALIVVIGICLGYFTETAIFILSFASLMVYAGGYHARTHAGCIATFTLIYLANIGIVSITPDWLKGPISIGAAILAYVYIWINAPIEHKNRPFEGDEYNRFKGICRIILVIEFIAVMALNIIATNHHLPYCIALAMLSVVFVLALARIIK